MKITKFPQLALMSKQLATRDKATAPEQCIDWDAQVAIFRDATDLTRTKASAPALAHVDTVLGTDLFDPSRMTVSILIDHSGSLRGQ